MKISCKRILSGALAIGLTLSLSTIALANEQVSAFDDVPETHGAYTDIMTIVNKGAIEGTKDVVNGIGHFEPDTNVSLGQFLTIATRLIAPDKINETKGSHWATPYYNAAIQAGIIQGKDFLPTDLDHIISREDMAYILVNVAKANGETLEVTPNIESTIKDYYSISASRQQAVLQAYSNGLLQGNDGSFTPNGPTKRSQIAAVFCRVMNYVTRPTPPNPDIPQDGNTIMGGYVSNKGTGAGKLMPEYSKKFDFQALSQIRMGEDSKGVYVTFTAPELPQEIKDSFTYNFSAIVHDSKGLYFANNARANLKSGETATIYFEAHDGGPIKSSQIGDALVGVDIVNSDNAYMLSHQADTFSHSKAVESWYNGDSTLIDFDSTAIFKGINK